jgi:hypothetical protein
MRNYSTILLTLLLLCGAIIGSALGQGGTGRENSKTSPAATKRAATPKRASTGKRGAGRASQGSPALVGEVLNNGSYYVTYGPVEGNIVFTMEATDDFTNDFAGEYPDTDFASISVDVNRNYRIDSLKDAAYGTRNGSNDICTYYFYDEKSATACGGFKSQASLRVYFGGTEIESRPHPVWEFTIPKSELSDDGATAHVQFKFFTAGRGYSTIPAEQNPEDWKFTAVSQIRLNF